MVKKNNEENKLVRNQLNLQSKEKIIVQSIPTTGQSTTGQVDSIPSTSREPVPSTSKDAIANTSAILDTSQKKSFSEPSEIIYEKDGLQLLVEKGMFQRQKKFSLQANKA